MSRRSERRRSLIPAALVALIALGAASAPSPERVLNESQGTAFQVSKEYVDPKRAQKEKKKKIRIGAGNGKEPWQWDRRGNARDSIGNFRSAKRLRRKILTAMVGVPNSGRQ